MISAFSAYSISNAVNMHFTNGSTYDYFRYNGKTRVSEDSFLGRKDKYFFERIARKAIDETQFLYLTWSNVLFSKTDGKVYIRNVSEEPFNKLLSLTDAFEYKFSSWVSERLSNGKLDISRIKTDIFTGSELEKAESLFFLLIINEFIYGKKLETMLSSSQGDLLNRELALKLNKHGQFCKTWMLSKYSPEFSTYVVELYKNLLQTI